MDDLISRQAAIDAVENIDCSDGVGISALKCEAVDDGVTAIKALPSAQPDYQEVLGWLLAYHTMSFNLHGRYLPHEVISWIINDFTKGFIAERESR